MIVLVSVRSRRWWLAGFGVGCLLGALAIVGVAGAALAASFFPALKVTSEPFVAAGLESSSLHPWSGSPSPVLRFTANDELPLTASFSMSTSSGATLTVSHPDAYSRVGVIDSGAALGFSGRLSSPSLSTATVTFSLVDTKALAVNLFGGATPASSINGLVSAFEKGPGATLLYELKGEIIKALTGKQSKIIVVKNVSALLIKFGASREDRKWLLDNLKVTSLKLLIWARDVAQAAGAYFGLAHVGVGGTETLTLSAQQTQAGGAGLVSELGAVGPLRLDDSTAAVVEDYAGTPDFKGTGTFEAPVGAGTPDYQAMGYDCSKSPAAGRIDPGAYHPAHVYCRTVYFFNPYAKTLSAFWTSSPMFRTKAGTRPGMAQSEADKGEGRFATGSARPAISLTSPVATLDLDNRGGTPKVVSQNAPYRWVGGTVGDFAMESHRNPVGLLFV